MDHLIDERIPGAIAMSPETKEDLADHPDPALLNLEIVARAQAPDRTPMGSGAHGLSNEAQEIPARIAAGPFGIVILDLVQEIPARIVTVHSRIVILDLAQETPGQNVAVARTIATGNPDRATPGLQEETQDGETIDLFHLEKTAFAEIPRKSENLCIDRIRPRMKNLKKQRRRCSLSPRPGCLPDDGLPGINMIAR